MIVFKRLLLVAGLSFGMLLSANATSFVVNKISIEGLQRINRGTVLTYLPIKVGERLTMTNSSEIIHDLYKTGFFSDVKLYHRDNTLVVKVVERPTIGKIDISGNEKITTKKLTEALKQAGLEEGHVFKRNVLVAIRQALLQQYYSLGYYSVKVTADSKEVSRNRVEINIDVHEGPVAKIKQIRVLGNKSFSEKLLLKQFNLSTSVVWSYFTNANQYSKEKLAADLEALRSYYLDRGYLQFKIDSANVSITPDKKSVYIVIHVAEGPIYKISGFKVSGNLIGKSKDIRALVNLKAGEVFSRQKIIDINKEITKFLGNYGYAYSDIKIQPKVNDRRHTVFVNFDVNPGKLVYVRHITFSGNSKTADYVLRREMRQMEGGVFALPNVDESKRKLANLGYLQNVESKIVEVPGRDDQVDVNYSMKEASSLAFSVQFGYSDLDGFLYGANLNDRNFLGSGKSVGMQFTHTVASRVFNINYFNPYMTQNHISVAFNLYNQHTSPGRIGLSTYSTDNYGGDVSYGFPISENNTINLGYGYKHIKLKTDSGVATEIANFINEHGSNFNQFRLMGGWNYSSLDQIIFPNKGTIQSLNGEFGLPIGGRRLEYFKVAYNGSLYHPLGKGFGMNLHANLNYGDGYGKGHELPFFMNYFAGGMGTVRGFEGGSLGPRDSKNDPLGGNVCVSASAGLILPNIFSENIRTTAFVDTGNVYQNRLDLGKLRYSAGVQLEWRSAFAPLVFSLATPISRHAGDRTELFQFNIGTSF